ncbi:MAG: hypothetical protein ABSB22_19695 [Thermodesulfobacteriota bacterium]|jgi:hypothetical protein
MQAERFIMKSEEGGVRGQGKDRMVIGPGDGDLNGRDSKAAGGGDTSHFDSDKEEMLWQ